MNGPDCGERHDRDSLSADLDAMRKIANALDSLRHDHARQRVLQCAQNRYHATLAPQPTTARSVEAAKLTPSVTAKPRAGVKSMIRGLAADVRRLALE